MPKPKKKRTPKNPTDPNLLARSVIEAAIGEPLTHKDPRRKKHINNATKAASAKRGKKV